MKPAVVLCRISSLGEKQKGYSLDVQEYENLDYAEKHDLTVIKMFSFVETASKPQHRKRFAEMLQFIKENQIKHLIVLKLDRFIRNHKDLAQIEDMIQEGLNVHLVRPGIVWKKGISSSDRRRIMFDAFLADDEIYHLAERTREGMLAKIKQGKPLIAPYGYEMTKDSEVVVNKQTAKIVKKIFKMYSTGDHSAESIARKLNEDDVTPPKGKLWYGTTIWRILSNPFYYGKIKFKGELYDGKHTPIISYDLYSKCQERVPVRRKAVHSKRFPLTQILYYENGRKFSGEVKKKTLVYYSVRTEEGRASKRMYLPEKMVQNLILEQVKKIHWPKSFANKVLKAAKEILRQEIKNARQNATTVQRHISRIQNQQKKLLDAYLAGVIDLKEFSARRNALERELLDYSTSQKLANADWNKTYGKLENLALFFVNLPQIYEAATIEKQAKILRSFLERIIIHEDKRLSFHYREPYSYFMGPELFQLKDNPDVTVEELLLSRPLGEC